MAQKPGEWTNTLIVRFEEQVSDTTKKINKHSGAKINRGTDRCQSRNDQYLHLLTNDYHCRFLAKNIHFNWIFCIFPVAMSDRTSNNAFANECGTKQKLSHTNIPISLLPCYIRTDQSFTAIK